MHQPAERRELLAALACRHADDGGSDTGFLERREQPFAVKRRHRLVGHNHDSRCLQKTGAKLARAVDQAGTDRDVVAATGEAHANDALAHAAAPAGCGSRWRRSASRTWSVVISAGWAVDSTTRSASA